MTSFGTSAWSELPGETEDASSSYPPISLALLQSPKEPCFGWDQKCWTQTAPDVPCKHSFGHHGCQGSRVTPTVLPLALLGLGQLTSISIQVVVGHGVTPVVCVKGVIFFFLKKLLLKEAPTQAIILLVERDLTGGKVGDATHEVSKSLGRLDVGDCGPGREIQASAVASKLLEGLACLHLALDAVLLLSQQARGDRPQLGAVCSPASSMAPVTALPARTGHLAWVQTQGPGPRSGGGMKQSSWLLTLKGGSHM